MIRRQKHFILWFLAFCMAVVIFMLSTNIGLQWSLYGLKKVLPQLTIQQPDGRWLGPLSFKKLEFKTQSLQVIVTDFHLDWNPWYLFKEIHIKDLVVGNIRVGLEDKPDSEPETASPPPQLENFLRSPYPAKIKNARISGFQLVRGGGEIKFQNINLAAEQKFNQWRIQRAAFRFMDLIWAGKGTATLSADLPVELEILWMYELPKKAKINGSGIISGNLMDLQLRQSVRGAVDADINGHVYDVLSGIHWNLKADTDKVNLTAMVPNTLIQGLHGNVDFTGNPRKLVFSGNLTTEQFKYGVYRNKFNIEFEEGTWRVTDLNVKAAKHPLTLQAKGQIDKNGQYTVTAQWSDFTARPFVALDMRSDAGNLAVNGNFKQAHFKGGLWLEGRQIPKGRWNVEATTDFSSLDIKQIQATILEGQISGDGRLQWAPYLSWSGSFQSRNIDPGLMAAQWPGRISSNIDSKGEWKDGRLKLRTNINKLAGRLRNQPVSGGGQIILDDTQYAFKNVNLQLGQARLAVNGDLGKQWALQWDLNVPELASILPTGKGQFRIRGNLQGTLDTPRLRAGLQANQFSIAQMAIKRMDGQLTLGFNKALTQLNLTDPFQIINNVTRSQIELQGEQIKLANQQINQVSLLLAGDNKKHDVHIEMDADFAKATFNLYGRFADKGFRETFRTADIDIPNFGLWQLERPGNVYFSANQLKVEEFCLKRTGTSLCQMFEWQSSKGWNLLASVYEFPISQLSDFLPPNLTLSTMVDTLTVSASSKPGQPINAAGKVQTHGGQVTYYVPGGEIISVSHEPSKANFDIAQNRANGQFQLKLKNGEITGDLKMPITAAQPDNDMAIRIRAKLQEIQEFFALLPFIEETRGRFNADVMVQGKPGDLQFTVNEAQLNKGGTRIPKAGIELESVDLNIKQKQKMFTINGGLTSGGGRLNFESKIHIDKIPWRTEAKVIGDKVQLINLSQYRLLVSPDIKIRSEGREIRINGDIRVPEARFQPKEFTTAATVSDDQVIVGEAYEKQAEPLRIYNNTTIFFGDNVKFKLAATGLKIEAKIQDKLQIIDKPQTPTLANGELSIAEGKVNYVGQELIIESGRITYFGGPIDLPTLDVVALRKIEDVKVGVNVRGTWPNLQRYLISEPPLDQTNILSYLIMGRPVNDLGESEGSDLQNKALLLVGADAANRIGKLFGLDEVKVKAEDAPEANGEDPRYSVEVGKYLSPKLYVGYSFGFATALNIRYQLEKNVSFQATTNSLGESSGDIVFTHETNGTKDKPKKKEKNDSTGK